jgi:pimeloyl-ACP methyl ester carboxylesterase
MRYFAGAFVCALFALGLVREATHAQSIAPTTVPKFETEPFSGAELLRGKRITQAECAALPDAVWVAVDQQGECIRYYHSTAGGSGPELVVSFSTEVASTNARGEVKPYDFYVKQTPAAMQDQSAGWSRGLRMPYLYLARPGTYGSSGEYARQRTPREIDLIAAALDAIKSRHGYTRLHLAGNSEGGHAAAALLARRSDLGCVALASSLLSVRSRLAEAGRDQDVTGNKHPVDPVALVDQVVKRPDLRIIVVTDPDDAVISARSQTAYVRRASAAGLPVQQIFAAATDSNAHNLSRAGLSVVADCARGVKDDAIVSKYQNKMPETLPDADDPPLNAPGVLTRSVTVNESQCKSLRNAVWVRVDGTGYCVRYWISAAGGSKDEAVVFVHGDLGDAKTPGNLNRYAALMTAGRMQRDVQRWSRVYGGPYIVIGRLGAFGSSGDHRKQRRSLLEIRVVTAALDELKVRHGLKRFHLAGQSGGAHTVAGLGQMRADVGCAVMAAGPISLKTWTRDSGRKIDPGTKALYDPIDHVAAMQHQPGRRMIVMSDPDDQLVSFHSQREFAERARAKSLPVLHVSADSGTENFHGLHNESQSMAIDCAKDMDDSALVAKYQNKATPGSGGVSAVRSR